MEVTSVFPKIACTKIIVKYFLKEKLVSPKHQR